MVLPCTPVEVPNEADICRIIEVQFCHNLATISTWCQGFWTAVLIFFVVSNLRMWAQVGLVGMGGSLGWITSDFHSTAQDYGPILGLSAAWPF